jgi:peptidoglycan/LPS O-acetylase OafA/YrhL
MISDGSCRRVAAEGLGHLWSLAIEEQFYLVWPSVLILFLGVRRNADLVLAVLVAAIAPVGVNRFLVWETADWWVIPFVRTDTRADSPLWRAARRGSDGARRTAGPLRVLVLLSGALPPGRVDRTVLIGPRKRSLNFLGMFPALNIQSRTSYAPWPGTRG